MHNLMFFVLLSILVLGETLGYAIHRHNDLHHDNWVATATSPLDPATFPRSVRSVSNGEDVANDTEKPGNSHNAYMDGIKLISWHFHYVRLPLIISIFLIVTAICKLVFHAAEFLSSIVPESCLLICLGTMVGGTFNLLGGAKENFVNFSAQLFFLYLLPPIILDAAFSLHHRAFFDNIGTVLLYAVVGTILNWIIIGPGLYALSLMGVMGTFNITLVHCFVFSSLIVAVDPVAVLAIFQEIGINNVLYFLIFGESLLNDAVTVVLYNMMKSFNVMEVIPPNQLLLGFVSFFTVSLGGLTTGVAFGLMSAILTRGTRHVQVVEPLTIFVFAYTAYLVAELFHFSGIISIIGCGLMQAQYAFHNISNKSCTTVKYFSKMMSSTCDSVIFLFLGLSLVQSKRIWHSGFIFTAIGLCLLVRFIVVFFLTFIANKLMRLRPVNIEEQFIMAYGGLRGAVAFSLVANLDKKTIPHQGLFETATLAIIIFTVFMQGITIKPLVRLLSIQRDSEKVVSIFEEINDHVIDHVMAGMEVVLGHYGTNSFREIAERVDTHYMQPYLLREPQTKDDHIMELYQKIALQLHLELVAGPKAAELYSLSYMDLYKIPVWTPHPEMASIMRGKELFEESVAMKLRRCSAPAKASYLTQTKEGRRSVNPDVRVYEPSQSDEQGFRLVQQCIRQLHTSEPKLEPKVPVVRDIRRLLDKNSVMKTNPRYDQTLSHDFANFLLHHLQEKQLRNARFQHAISMYSSPSSSNPVITSITPSDTVLLNIYNPEVDRTKELPFDETVSTNVRKSQSENSSLDQSHISGLPPRIQLNPDTFRPGETLAGKTKPNLANNGKKHQNRDEPGPSKK